MSGNGKSGRRRKPLALKLLHGSRIRPHDELTAQHAQGVPEMPEHLASDDLATAQWEVLVERLSMVNVLTSAHGEALAILAEAWADYVRCRQQFERMGRQLVVVDEKTSKDGTKTRRVKDNPLIRRSERLALLVQRYLGEFGLTPATGTKVGAVGGFALEDDPFAKYDRPA